MRNISIVAIAFLIILCYSCDKESSENALTKDKMVGSWIWTNENGETVQVDTNKVDLNIGNCPEQMHFKEIITRETIWEFELDGDFEEKLILEKDDINKTKVVFNKWN